MDIKLKKHFTLTKKSQHDLLNEKPLFNKISTTVEKTKTPTVVVETVPSNSSSRVRKNCDIRDLLQAKPKQTPKKRRCDDLSPKTPRKRRNLFRDTAQTQLKDDKLNTPEKKVHQNAVGTNTTSKKISINEEKVQPSLEKNTKPLNKNLIYDSLKQVEVSSSTEKIIEDKASVLRTPSNRKLGVSDCLMKIKKRKKLQAIPKMITQSEMLQKVNEQNTEETTFYTNKEVKDFIMSAGNADSTGDQNQLVLPRAYKTLLEIFESFDTVLRFLNNRGEKAVWTNIRLSVKNMSKKNFTKHQLGQMKYILPSAFDLKVEKVTSYKSRNIRNDFDIIIKPTFDGGVVSEGIKKMDLTICKKRLKQFKLNLLALVKCEHQKFLASKGINDLKHEKLVKWHMNFNVNESAVQIPSASVPSADSLNSQSSCVRKMLIETKKQKDEQVAEVQKLLVETKEEEKSVEKTPKFLQKVPEALLRKVREKEKNRNIRNMINNHVGSQKLQQLEKLPAIALSISLLYRSKKRSCLKHEEMLRHLSNAHNLTMHETEQLLDLLVGNCDGWLQIIDISDTRYVKKMKVDMSVQQVKQVIDGKMKSLS